MLVPQIAKTIKLKDTKEVSIALFIVYLAANIIALTYAFLISQTPLKIKYSIGILTSIFYIAVFIYQKTLSFTTCQNLKDFEHVKIVKS